MNDKKSITIYISAIDGGYSRRFKKPASALAFIDHCIGGLNLDGMVSADGVCRLSGIVLTNEYGTREELSLRSLKKLVGPINEGKGDFHVNEMRETRCSVTDAFLGYQTFKRYAYETFDKAFEFMNAKNEEAFKRYAYETFDKAFEFMNAKNEEVYDEYSTHGEPLPFEIPHSQYPPVQGCERNPEEELYASPF